MGRGQGCSPPARIEPAHHSAVPADALLQGVPLGEARACHLQKATESALADPVCLFVNEVRAPAGGEPEATGTEDVCSAVTSLQRRKDLRDVTGEMFIVHEI